MSLWAAAALLACLVPLRLALGEAGLFLDVGVAIAAAVAIRVATRLARGARSRIAWHFQLAVPLLWLIAPVVWIVDGPEAIATVARSAALLAAATAWWLTSQAGDSWSRVRLAIDGGLTAGSTFVVAWDPILRDIWEDDSGGLGAIMALVIPLGAVWIAMFVVGLTVTEMQGRHRIMPTLFVASLLVIAGSDMAWERGAVPPWSAAWLLAICATLAYVGTSGRREVVSTRWTLTYAPYALILPAVIAFAYHGAERDIPRAEVVVAGLMIVLLLSRQHVTLAENRALVQRLAETEKALRYQATHDHLTGLAGRVLLLERLDRASNAYAAVPFDVAVLFVDLDGFKLINDVHGHAVGDHVLVETARRLIELTAPLGDDALAVRMSGDEFAVLITGEAARGYEEFAERVPPAIAAPIHVNGEELSVGASVGAAMTSSDTLSPSGLLRAADVAMYRNKHRRQEGREADGTRAHEIDL